MRAAARVSAYGKIVLDFSFGRVAQLGERIHGMDEVAGSTPVTSTKFFLVVDLLNYFSIQASRKIQITENTLQLLLHSFTGVIFDPSDQEARIVANLEGTEANSDRTCWQQPCLR